MNKKECNSWNFYHAAGDERCNNAIENNTIEYVNCENCLVIYGNIKKEIIHTHTHQILTRTRAQMSMVVSSDYQISDESS